jgi:hypothetical protein
LELRAGAIEILTRGGADLHLGDGLWLDFKPFGAAREGEDSNDERPERRARESE